MRQCPAEHPSTTAAGGGHRLLQSNHARRDPSDTAASSAHAPTDSLDHMRRMFLAALALVLVGCSSAQPLAVDLSPTAEQGLKLAQQSGCASCHGSDFGGGTGPTWQGIIGQSVAFKGGESGVVDREYLIESIKYPDMKKRVGYSVVMPYNNLTDEQISNIVDYIEALSN